jgi:PKHD-type hydroxylase
MRHCWQLWSGILSNDTCDQIVESQIKTEPIEAQMFNSDDPDYRRSKIRWVTDTSIKNVLWHYAKEANRNAFGFDVTDMSAVQFTEYRAEDTGTYNWHHDVDWQSGAAFDRKISVVVQLSDPDVYEGCDFRFANVPNPYINQLRAKGTVLCFPSYLEHQVTEITKGTRHSLVAWFEGPRWR